MDVRLERPAAQRPALTKRSSAVRMVELREALKKLDPDGSGAISVQLVHEAMQCIGIKFSLKELTEELLADDTDGDGNLELHEVEGFLQHDAELERAGLSELVNPWSIGRSLALDALPMAARAFSAHCVVQEVMQIADPPKAAADSKTSSGRVPSVPRAATGSGKPPTSAAEAMNVIPKKATAIDGEALSSPASPTPPAQHQSPNRTASPVRSISPTASPPSKVIGSPTDDVKPRSRHFVLWEETRRDFAEYASMRREYEARWNVSRRSGHRHRHRDTTTQQQAQQQAQQQVQQHARQQPTPMRPRHTRAMASSSSSSGLLTGQGAGDALVTVASKRRLVTAPGGRMHAQERLSELKRTEARLDRGSKDSLVDVRQQRRNEAAAANEASTVVPPRAPWEMGVPRSPWAAPHGMQPPEPMLPHAAEGHAVQRPIRRPNGPRFQLGVLSGADAAAAAAIAATHARARPSSTSGARGTGAITAPAVEGAGMRRVASAGGLRLFAPQTSPLTADERRERTLQRAQTPQFAFSAPPDQHRPPPGPGASLRRQVSAGVLATVADEAGDERPKGARLRLSTSLANLRPALHPVGPVITSKHATAAQELRRKRESEATLQRLMDEATEEKAPSPVFGGPAKLDVVDDSGDEF